MKIIIFSISFIAFIACSAQDTHQINLTPKFSTTGGDFSTKYIHLLICPDDRRKDQDECKVLRDMLEFGCPSITECNYDRWANHQRTGRSQDIHQFIEVHVCHRDGTNKDYTFEEFKEYLYGK